MGLEATAKQFEKNYGKGMVYRLGDNPVRDIDVIPTGNIALDVALGVGGWARGRIVEIYGPESCLDAESFVRFEVRKPDGTRQNHKGGTIRSLWHRFHQIPKKGQGGYLRATTAQSQYFLACMNEDGRIFQNRIVDVVDTGLKPCLTVRTDDGQVLTATSEHKFFSNGKFMALSDLQEGDTVSIHNNTPFTNGGKERDAAKWRKDIFLAPIHPVAGKKTVKENGHVYTYSRIAESRAIAEAHLNGLTMNQYRLRFTSGDISGMKFLRSEDHVHHEDEDETNNAIENLIVISAEEHGRLHALERHNNLRYQVVDTTIVSMETAGERDTFDIKMESPFNNYIAEGFVVHNSGKTTIATHAVASCQKHGGICAYVDAEQAVDPAYTQAIGVNIDDLWFCQPDNAEQSLEIALDFVKSGEVALVVVDSVAALTPRAEIAGEMGDTHVGLQSRLMSQAMRKMVGEVRRTNTTVIFINQIREKIGVMFGSPETTPGGRALKFYASQRVDIRRKEQIKSGVEIIGNKTVAKVVKNKVAPPFKVAEFDIMYGEGASPEATLLDWASDYNVIKKNGAFYYDMGGVLLGQGKEAARRSLKEQPHVYEEMYDLTMNAIYGEDVPDESGSTVD